MECSGNLGKWFCSNKSQTFRPTFLSLSFLRTATFLITWCCFCSLLTLTSGQSCTPVYQGRQIRPEDDLKVTPTSDKVATSENTIPVTSVLVLEGIDFNLSCTVSIHHIVKWRFGKTDIINDDVFTISPTISERPGQLTTHLRARNITRNLSGEYKCVAGGCQNGSNVGLHIRVISAEKPLIDFQATIPRKVEQGQSYTLVVSAIVGQPANMSCITKMLPIRSPKWRKKVQIGNDIKWEEMDKNCIEKMDEEAAIEETKWLSKRSSKEKPPKCFIFNVSLADGSRNVTIFFPILKEEDLGDYSCGITSDPIEHAKTDAMVTLEAVNVRVKREKAQTIKRDPAIQYELPNKTYIDISAHRKFKGSVSSLTVVEGETALIFCDLSWPGPEERRSIHGHGYHVRWFKDDIHIQYTDDPEGIRRITTNKTQTLITLGNANLTDRGMYRCDILDKDDNKIASFQYQVRVRSKVAALWPFIAICVEVAIICLIILIYEKTKSKAEIADSDTDGSPDQKNVSDNNDGEAEALRLQEKE